MILECLYRRTVGVKVIIMRGREELGKGRNWSVFKGKWAKTNNKKLEARRKALRPPDKCQFSSDSRLDLRKPLVTIVVSEGVMFSVTLTGKSGTEYQGTVEKKL